MSVDAFCVDIFITDTLDNCLYYRNGDRGVYVYRGIKYAEADRFTAPVICKAASVDGDYRDAAPFAYQTLWRRIDSTSVFSEDCLVMTVSSPVPLGSAAADTLPVLVHIHGGSFLHGSGERNDSQLWEFALREQMVCVSISYRLGVFGYLYLSDQTDYNLGLKDQLMALRWIHDNIADFGGDKNRITLSGQSAGAQSVVFCLADTNRVAIQRAVVFSAPIGLEMSKTTERSHSRSICGRLGDKSPWTCAPMDLLRAQASWENDHRLVAMPFMPAAISQMPSYGKLVSWPEQVVVTAQDEDASIFSPTKGFEPGITAYVFTAPGKKYVRYLRKLGVNALYHEFTWRPHGSKYKVTHCMELPLFIGFQKEWPGKWLMGDVTEEELEPLRHDFMDRFAHFIRTGIWTFE